MRGGGRAILGSERQTGKGAQRAKPRGDGEGEQKKNVSELHGRSHPGKEECANTRAILGALKRSARLTQGAACSDVCLRHTREVAWRQALARRSGETGGPAQNRATERAEGSRESRGTSGAAVSHKLPRSARLKQKPKHTVVGGEGL